MKSNVQSDSILDAGIYWVCDPADILPDYLAAEMTDGDLECGIWSVAEKFRSFIGDTECGRGCFAFVDWERYNAVETATGYIGIFPDVLIRDMRIVTRMKRCSGHGIVMLKMDEEFSIDKMDYGLDVGHHRLEKVLGE